MKPMRLLLLAGLAGFVPLATTFAADVPAPTAAEKSAAPVTLFLAGDSTMASQPVVPASPLRGWGQMLQPYFTSAVRVENHAASGNSTKSFLDGGRWQALLDRVREGDFVIIQFGHNDAKPDEKRHTEPFGSFQANLERFVRDVRERRATPILATSVVRNVWDADGTLRDTHGDYVVAARKAAGELRVPLLDLNARTADIVRHLGPERSKQLFNNAEPGDFAKFPEGNKDGSHFNTAGACRVCDLAIEEIAAKVPELASAIQKSAPFAPERAKAK